jgi:hypothetical protein
MSDKWKRIADVLAGRLMYHDFCDHNPPEEDCPFCDDEAAMKIYRKAGGNVGLPAAQGKMVGIRELKFP